MSKYAFVFIYAYVYLCIYMCVSVCIFICLLLDYVTTISSLCSQQIIYGLLSSAGCCPKIVLFRPSSCHCCWSHIYFEQWTTRRLFYWFAQKFVRARYFSSTITSVFGIFVKRLCFLFILAIWECSNWIFTIFYLIRRRECRDREKGGEGERKRWTIFSGHRTNYMDANQLKMEHAKWYLIWLKPATAWIYKVIELDSFESKIILNCFLSFSLRAARFI